MTASSMPPTINPFCSVHEFWQQWGETIPKTPVLDRKSISTYLDFVTEEMREIREDLDLEDPTATIMDGACDAFVYLTSMLLRGGYYYIFPYMYREVMNSNRTKGDGSRLFDDTGRMIKGQGYRKPDLRRFMKNPLSVRPEIGSLLSVEELRGLGVAVSSPTQFQFVLSTQSGVPPFCALAYLLPHVDVEEFLL